MIYFLNCSQLYFTCIVFALVLLCLSFVVFKDDLFIYLFIYFKCQMF